MDIEMAVKHASITEYVEKSIIPFILDLDDENNIRQVGCYGTGTLFSFLNKYFIVTAGHVVENIDRIRTVLGIPVKRFESEILTLGDCRFHFPQNKIDIAKYDIGIIELRQELYEKLLLSYHFLNENDIQFLLTNTNVYISGYPNSFTTFDKQGNCIRAKPFKLMSQFKKSKIEGYKNYDPKVHFLIEYSDIYYAGNDPSKKENAEQNLGGISGCSMWMFNDNVAGIWSAEKCLKVIGIQSHLMESEYIKGTKWGYIIGAFKNIDIDIYNLLLEKYDNEMKIYN